MSLDPNNPYSEKKLSFREELHLQRWDDHRYYHHSRMNQSLHLMSSICFMTCYALLFFNPGAAALLGWIVAMSSRQIGHFFFEPRAYDDVNHATHKHKEKIKVGYNLQRKRVLQTVWALTPLMLYLNPTFFGIFAAHINWDEYLQNLAYLWIWLGVIALAVRTVHLFFIENVQTGLVWATKIITDPFNDFKTYCKSPFYLMKGEKIDPMIHVAHGVDPEEEEREALAR